MKFRMVQHCLVLTLCASVSAICAEDQVPLVEAWDPYCPKREVSGEIELAGSTTMQQLAALWADGFQQIHPQVTFKIDCRGSESALPLLAKDKSVIGLMSRPVGEDELRRLARDGGAKVVALAVCHDVLGVVVHKENPLSGLFFPVDGGPLHAADGASLGETWGDLGLPQDWSTVPLAIHGPTSQSGTRNYFDRLFPRRATDGAKMTEHASRAELMRAVSNDRGGLGLVSLSRGALQDVRLVPVGVAGQDATAPKNDTITTRQYPLVRSLTILVGMSGESLDEPLAEEFVAYVLSRCGQHDVIKDGFVPLSRSELHIQEEKLGWKLLK